MIKKGYAMRCLAFLIGVALPLASFGKDGKRFLESALNQANEGKPAEALVSIQGYIDELRASDLDPQHPAIAYALACAGTIADSAGEYEKAVQYLEKSLPILKEKARPGFLLHDEFGFILSFASSLEHLNRREDATEVLEELLARTRKQVEWISTGILSGKKGFTDEGRQMGLSALYPSEDWILAILQLLGDLREKQEEWAKAESAFKEAEAILEKLHPEKQAKLAELREKWELAARKQGKAIRPKHVGRFSSPRSIDFEGVDSFPEEEIRSALLRSSSYILASHPAGDFDEYLKILERCLELGYHESGFPNVTVSVDWNQEDDRIHARIEEGIGFRAGEIHLEGADPAIRQEILDSIIVSEDDEKSGPTQTRSEIVLEQLSEAKKIPEDQVKTALAGAFPEFSALQEEKDSIKKLAPSWASDLFPMPSEDLEKKSATKPFWETGEKVNYQPKTLRAIRRRVRAAYTDQGKPFPIVQADWDPKPESGVVNIRISVESEGPSLKLGKIHVEGNRINTKEEVVDYLGLETGQDIKGDLQQSIELALFDSGRFLAWDVTKVRNGPAIDLLIIVDEHWEAPPLSAPLSKGQQAILKFAKWFNEEAGTDDELRMNLTVEATDAGIFETNIILGNNSLGFTAKHSEVEKFIAGEFTASRGMKFLVATDEKALFQTSQDVGEIPLHPFLKLVQYRSDKLEDFPRGFVQHGVLTQFGSSAKRAVGGLMIDPTLALSHCSSWADSLMQIQEGAFVIRSEGFLLKVNADTGHLLSLQVESNDLDNKISLNVEPCSNELAEFRSWFSKKSDAAPNWSDGKDPYSFLFLASAFVGELMQGTENMDNADPDEVLQGAGTRTLEKWSSLSSVAGQALGSIFQSRSSDSDDSFEIPTVSWDLEKQYQSGGNLMLLLNFGFYDFFAPHVEPGTWPDLVLKEILFVADGKPHYLEQTIETLLKDEEMGPIGCLICSGLLQKLGHKAAPSFVRKAQEQLSAEGFAGDWSLLFEGKAEEGGVGWSLLRVIQELEEDQIDRFLSKASGEARTSVKDLISRARTIEDASEADSLAPVMDALWEHVLKDPISELVAQREKRLNPEVDPSIFAASVNGMPVPRAAVKLLQEISRMTNGKSSVGLSPLDENIGLLLMAQELWSTGKSATPQAVERRTSAWIQMFGPEGLEKLQSMGFNSKILDWWAGVQLAAEAQAGVWASTKELEEEAARDYFKQNPNLFIGSQERKVHLIALQKSGNESQQRELLNEVLMKVQGSDSLKEKLKIFHVFAGEHNRIKREENGNLGWIKPKEEWFPELAKVMGEVPDGEVSEVLEARGHLFLVLVEESQPGKLESFEKAAKKAHQLALLEREQELLRKKSLITIYEETESKTKSLSESPENPSSSSLLTEPLASISKLGESLAGRRPGNENEDRERSAEEKPDTRNLLQKTIDEAATGDPESLYVLGAFAERGFGPKPGLQPAIDNYWKAAEAGNRKAMLRLSELYRIGRGVKSDQEESDKWKEKADSALEVSSD